MYGYGLDAMICSHTVIAINISDSNKSSRKNQRRKKCFEVQFVALSLLGFVPSKVLSYFISYEKLQ